MSARALFVTGTDTGVGKTRAAVALVQLARQLGIDAVGFKPVASGCEPTPDGWRNDDALQLQAAGGDEAYAAINPYALPEPIAPHLAAADQGLMLDIAVLDAAFDALAARHELVIVEGAGGWRVPLNAQTDFAGWVAARRWPVVLVVALRLGALNHALLSAESIAARTALAGWIGNVLPPRQPRLDDNLDWLLRTLPAPSLGLLPEGGDADANRTALDTAATRGLLTASTRPLRP